MPTSCEPGAPAPSGTIPLSVPEISGNEWQYLRECLDTNFVSSVGPFVERFERELAALVGARYAVAATSGTAALHVALLVAGIEPDDEVIVPALTFIAPVNAVRYVGAWPVVLDVEPDYGQIDCDRIEQFLAQGCVAANGRLRNRATGRAVRGLLPVHALGHPVDLDRLLALAARYDLRVIEDATEALGSKYKGRPVGSSGTLACFSFNGNKIVTTGGGGMIVTDDEAIARRARYLTTQAKDDPIEFVHGAVGFNYRLTNLQAAVGCAQLERLPQFVARKREIADRYRDGLAGVPGLSMIGEAPWACSNRWMSAVLVDRAQCGLTSRELLDTLGRASIQARPLWQPMHLSPAHRAAWLTDCPVAERLNRVALCLPCSCGLTPAEQDRVIETIAAAAQHPGAVQRT